MISIDDATKHFVDGVLDANADFPLSRAALTLLVREAMFAANVCGRPADVAHARAYDQGVRVATSIRSM